MKAILLVLSPKECVKASKCELSTLIRKNVRLHKAIQKLIKEQDKAVLFAYCRKGKQYAQPYLVRGNGLADYLSRIYDKNYIPEPNDFELYDFKDGGYSAQFYDFYDGKVIAKFEATSEIINYSNCFPLSSYETELSWQGDFEYETETLDEDELVKKSCLDNAELDDCLQGKDGTAVHIKPNTLKIFDKPKSVLDLWQSRYQYGEWYEIPLTCAPHPWCYVEV